MGLFHCCCTGPTPCVINAFGRRSYLRVTGWEKPGPPPVECQLYSTVEIDLHMGGGLEPLGDKLWHLIQEFDWPADVQRLLESEQFAVPGHPLVTPGTLPPTTQIQGCQWEREIDGWHELGVTRDNGLGVVTRPYTVRQRFSGLLSDAMFDGWWEALQPTPDETLFLCDNTRDEWAGYVSDGSLRIDTFNFLFMPGDILLAPPGIAPISFGASWRECGGTGCPFPNSVTLVRQGLASCADIEGSTACRRSCAMEWLIQGPGPCVCVPAGNNAAWRCITPVDPPVQTPVGGGRILSAARDGVYDYVTCGLCPP